MKKIVAVIPARGGSKGIPDKNIRFLGGKPLIAYSIQNALDSKYITDIIVTTDSLDVKMIAGQMGVKVRDRSAELCGDAVTLDAVIYDAVKDIEADYVVTMQPTSPTLKRETLDAAIEYAIENGLDTLISAHNHPHLAWTRDAAGKIVPAYKERLNRQYLPPYYGETGAFVVSRRAVVTPTSRIGAKVEVFDVSEEESIDIDSYGDLLQVQQILKKPCIGFYVNGNALMGSGHLYRALEIADMFMCPVDIYYDVNLTDRGAFGGTTHRLIGVSGIRELLEKLRQKEYTLFINDTTSTSLEYMEALRKEVRHARIVNFDDHGDGASQADMVVNPLASAPEHPAPNSCWGWKYFICNRLFLYYKPIPIRPEVKNVFILFGGDDVQDYTGQVYELIRRKEFKEVTFHLILGKDRKAGEWTGKPENIKIYDKVSNMPELMSQCDVAVASGARTCYELAIMGVPTIALSQNQWEPQNSFVSAENGFVYLGIKPSPVMLESMLQVFIRLSPEARRQYQQLLLSHDLRHGRDVVEKIIHA